MQWAQQGWVCRTMRWSLLGGAVAVGGGCATCKCGTTLYTRFVCAIGMCQTIGWTEMGGITCKSDCLAVLSEGLTRSRSVQWLCRLAPHTTHMCVIYNLREC